MNDYIFEDHNGELVAITCKNLKQAIAKANELNLSIPNLMPDWIVKVKKPNKEKQCQRN